MQLIEKTFMITIYPHCENKFIEPYIGNINLIKLYNKLKKKLRRLIFKNLDREARRPLI